VKGRGFTLDGAKKEMRSKNDLNYIDHKQEVVSKLEVIKSRIKGLM